MSSPFDGLWVGERGTLEVTSQGAFLDVRYTGGGGDFPAFAGNLGVPVIYSQWGSLDPFAGVLSGDGKTVYWQNGTVWNRNGG